MRLKRLKARLLICICRRSGDQSRLNDGPANYGQERNSPQKAGALQIRSAYDLDGRLFRLPQFQVQLCDRRNRIRTNMVFFRTLYTDCRCRIPAGLSAQAFVRHTNVRDDHLELAHISPFHATHVLPEDEVVVILDAC